MALAAVLLPLVANGRTDHPRRVQHLTFAYPLACIRQEAKCPLTCSRGCSRSDFFDTGIWIPAFAQLRNPFDDLTASGSALTDRFSRRGTDIPDTTTSNLPHGHRLLRPSCSRYWRPRRVLAE